MLESSAQSSSGRDPLQAAPVQAGPGERAPGGCLARGGQLGLAAGGLGDYPSCPRYKYIGRVNTWEEEKTSYFS